MKFLLEKAAGWSSSLDCGAPRGPSHRVPIPGSPGHPRLPAEKRVLSPQTHPGLLPHQLAQEAANGQRTPKCPHSPALRLPRPHSLWRKRDKQNQLGQLDSQRPTDSGRCERGPERGRVCGGPHRRTCGLDEGLAESLYQRTDASYPRTGCRCSPSGH